MRTHIKDQHTEETLCRAKSFYSPPEIAKEKALATCRVCRGLDLINVGKLYEMPFGGNYDKNGKPRKNTGARKRKHV